MYDWLDNYLNSGWDSESTSPSDLRRVRTLTATCSLIFLVALPFLWRAYQWQVPTRMVTVTVAVILCLLALIGLRRFNRYQSFAVLAVVAVYVGGVGAVISGGGIGSVAVGWLMLVPMLAGILCGIRGGVIWAGVVLATIGILFTLHGAGWDFSDQTPQAFRASQQLTQAFGLTFVGLVLMASYISQLGYSERVLAQRNQALLQQISRAEKAETETHKAVKSKTQFLANMSHELKTPLNSILGFTRHLHSAASDRLNEREQNALQEVVAQAEQMLYLVDDLLALSQVDENRLKLTTGTTNIQEVLGRVITEVTPLAERYGLEIEPQGKRRALMLECDVRRLSQAFAGLLRHCVKYSAGGPIRISSEALDESWLSVRMLFACVPLKDGELSRMFDRDNHLHSRVDREVGCSALALVVAAELIELHGGQVDVSLNQWGEMLFTIKLPFV